MSTLHPNVIARQKKELDYILYDILLVDYDEPIFLAIERAGIASVEKLCNLSFHGVCNLTYSQLDEDCKVINECAKLALGEQTKLQTFICYIQYLQETEQLPSHGFMEIEREGLNDFVTTGLYHSYLEQLSYCSEPQPSLCLNSKPEHHVEKVSLPQPAEENSASPTPVLILSSNNHVLQTLKEEWMKMDTFPSVPMLPADGEPIFLNTYGEQLYVGNFPKFSLGNYFFFKEPEEDVQRFRARPNWNG